MNDTQSGAAEETALLRAKLNGETSRMPWREMLRFFAGGNVLVIEDGLDLVDVALRIAQDDKAAIAAWLQADCIRHVSDDQARAWLDDDAQLWAVVVKPWVLVQRHKEAVSRA